MSNKEIAPEEVLRAIQSGNAPLIVDIRDAGSFKQGHIPGAKSNPAQSFDIGMFADLPKDALIVISCYRGMMSKDVAQYLASAGFTNAVSMKGGMNAWKKLAGAPIEY